MTLLAVIRHAPTDWNAAGRIHGRTDTDLGTAGRQVLATWRLPAAVRDFTPCASPLHRAVETATALFGRAPAVDVRLIEMAWGEWEGRTLADLRAELGAGMAALEAKGLDFRPPGGESPRDVQVRLAPLLADAGASGRAAAFVTHKGVLRALYAGAVGWDMTGKPPHRLRDDCCHLFTLDADGTAGVERLNLPLVPS